MRYIFKNYHGARLINVVITFLRKQGIVPLPPISLLQKKTIYDKDGITITFFCTNRNRGFYDVIQYIDGIPQVSKTPVFYYFDGR